jgi:hypothetical protein
MRTQAICLALVIVLLWPTVSAQWVQTGFPDSNGVSCWAVSDTYLFAGTNNGWGTGGLFVSSNKGLSWIEVMNSLTWKGISAIAILSGAAGDTIVLAGTGFGGVCRSSNNGTSWIEVNSGLPSNKWVTSFAVSGKNVFMGLYYGGVFLSADNGTSWTEAGLSDKNASALVVTPDGANVFAGTEGSIFRSTDNCTSWSEVNSGLPDVGTVYCFVTIRDASGGLNLFAGTWGGVFLSTNNGSSWTGTGLSSKPVNTVVVGGTNIFAGSWTGGVFLSTDNGTNWTPTGLTNKAIRSLVVIHDSTGGATLLAGTDDGVWRRPLSEMITDVETSGSLPTSFQLFQNHPNPFNPSTTIGFALPKSSVVKLSVHDMLGREVSVLVNERREAGVHEVKFQELGLSSGVYFYRLQSGDFVQSKKLVFLR